MPEPDPIASHYGDPFVDEIARAMVLPVLRTSSHTSALEAVERCVAADLGVLELTTTTSTWRTALAEAKSRHPQLLIGVGTIMLAEDAIDAIELGADFVVSPCPAPGVREVTTGRRPFVEGGMTVAEVLDASRRGIAKLFPAHVGGIAFLRSLLSLAPCARIIPTGGITISEVPAWLEAGALGVGVGTALCDEPDLPRAIEQVRSKAHERAVLRTQDQ